MLISSMVLPQVYSKQDATMKNIADALNRPWYIHTIGPELESIYIARNSKIRAKYTSACLIVFTVVVMLSVVGDARSTYPESTVWLRFGVELPVTLAVVAWIFVAPRPHVVAFAPMLPICLEMAVEVWLGLSMPTPLFSAAYLMGAGITGIIFNLVLPFRLQEAAILCFVILTIYIGLPLIHPSQLDQAHLNIIGSMSALIIASLEIVRHRERASKNALLFKLQEELHTTQLSVLVEDLTRLVHIDPLTGTGNRRSFEMRYGAVWRSAEAHKKPVELTLIDIDKFKLYNDTMGHPAGDACLRDVAIAIAAGAGVPLDAVARLGGEEFALLTPLVDKSGKLQVGGQAERVRSAVEALQLRHQGLGRNGVVTVSLGSAIAYPGSDRSTQDSLLQAADGALYQAKASGRNCVVIASRNALAMDA